MARSFSVSKWWDFTVDGDRSSDGAVVAVESIGTGCNTPSAWASWSASNSWVTADHLSPKNDRVSQKSRSHLPQKTIAPPPKKPIALPKDDRTSLKSRSHLQKERSHFPSNRIDDRRPIAFPLVDGRSLLDAKSSHRSNDLFWHQLLRQLLHLCIIGCCFFGFT